VSDGSGGASEAVTLATRVVGSIARSEVAMHRQAVVPPEAPFPEYDGVRSGDGFEVGAPNLLFRVRVLVPLGSFLIDLNRNSSPSQCCKNTYGSRALA
jgi:hypothetical protein